MGALALVLAGCDSPADAGGSKGPVDNDGTDDTRYTVTFNAGEGTFADGNSTQEVKVLKGYPVSAPKNPT